MRLSQVVNGMMLIFCGDLHGFKYLMINVTLLSCQINRVTTRPHNLSRSGIIWTQPHLCDCFESVTGTLYQFTFPMVYFKIILCRGKLSRFDLFGVKQCHDIKQTLINDLTVTCCNIPVLKEIDNDNVILLLSTSTQSTSIKHRNLRIFLEKNRNFVVKKLQNNIMLSPPSRPFKTMETHIFYFAPILLHILTNPSVAPQMALQILLKN